MLMDQGHGSSKSRTPLKVVMAIKEKHTCHDAAATCGVQPVASGHGPGVRPTHDSASCRERSFVPLLLIATLVIKVSKVVDVTIQNEKYVIFV